MPYPDLQGGFEGDDDAWRPQTMQEIMVFGHVCVGSTWQGDDKACKEQVPIGWIGGKGMPDRLLWYPWKV